MRVLCVKRRNASEVGTTEHSELSVTSLTRGDERFKLSLLVGDSQ
jgi:hypothetical protein